eukprot:Tamp_24118.p1 GENE.Tamp_24118~~Tamp_24118.p1  ORF type:complete len:103 (+),score=5.46 Tamp_24118:588-896(+)
MYVHVNLHTYSPPLLPPQNDLGQSYSASTSSSVLQLFSSPLSITLSPSPPLHAVDSISPPKFATEACNICTNRGPIVSWKNAFIAAGMPAGPGDTSPATCRP